MDVIERIKSQLSASPVVLYMKGTPDFPQCGFSAAAVRALSASGAQFAHVNIFEDPELREALKLLELADLSAAVRERRADRRLRHHPGDVQERRTAEACELFVGRASARHSRAKSITHLAEQLCRSLRVVRG